MGWWTGGVGHSTRSDIERETEREHASRYLDLDGRAVNWQFIRAVLSSVADTAIVPVQDLLGLGSDARMNRPGIDTGNWRWRLVPGQLTHETARQLAVMTEMYDRV
jgi:4-alpha-glucanotransferase